MDQNTCYGCRVESQLKAHHTYPGGCQYFTNASPEGGKDVSEGAETIWPTRMEVEEATHPAIVSLGIWIDILAEQKYCPILLSTQSAVIKDKETQTFTMYFPGVFPNDYQTFFSVASVKFNIENNPNMLPCWAKFSRGSGNAYDGRFLKLNPMQIKAFCPERSI